MNNATIYDDIATSNNTAWLSAQLHQALMYTDQWRGRAVLRRARAALCDDPGNIAWRSILTTWGASRFGAGDHELTDLTEFDELLAAKKTTAKKA